MVFYMKSWEKWLKRLILLIVLLAALLLIPRLVRYSHNTDKVLSSGISDTIRKMDYMLHEEPGELECLPLSAEAPYLILLRDLDRSAGWRYIGSSQKYLTENSLEDLQTIILCDLERDRETYSGKDKNGATISQSAFHESVSFYFLNVSANQLMASNGSHILGKLDSDSLPRTKKLHQNVNQALTDSDIQDYANALFAKYSTK